MYWDELTRVQLADLLPKALVVVPTGATEQHGPHLPTGVDSIIVTEVVRRAIVGREFSRPVIIAPSVRVGASDHHFPFGGTLSLSSETLIAVLLDHARSVAAGGGKNIVFVNGHGGNRGACMVATSAASTRYDMAAAYADYWTLLPPSIPASGDHSPVPGHAGEFETSMMMAIAPELVVPPTARAEVQPIPMPAGFSVHHKRGWAAINGHTDSALKATAQYGAECLEALATQLTDRLDELTKTLA